MGSGAPVRVRGVAVWLPGTSVPGLSDAVPSELVLGALDVSSWGETLTSKSSFYCGRWACRGPSTPWQLRMREAATALGMTESFWVEVGQT